MKIQFRKTVSPGDRSSVKRQGEAYVTEREILLPFYKAASGTESGLRGAGSKDADSRQTEDESWVGDYGLEPRPYPPDSFLELYEHNPTFFRCVNQIASDVAGLGWNLQLRKGKAEKREEAEKAEAFLKRPNPSVPLRRIFEDALIDLGCLGYYGIEVTTTRTGELGYLFPVQSQTLWAHRDGKKFCRRKGYGKKMTWFKKFGEDEDIDKDTGKTEPSSSQRASEIIWQKNHYGKSQHYGIPNVLPSVRSVLGQIGVEDFNLSDTTNFAVPAYAVLLKGDWKEGSVNIIRNFLDTEIKGSSNAHKTLVLQLPDDGDIEFKQLAVQTKEGSFRTWYETLRNNIMVAYSMPPHRIGLAIVGRLGGNIAEEQTKVYVQSVVEPLQETLEFIVNEQLLGDRLGIRNYEWKLNNIDTRNLDADADRCNAAIDHGWMTRNEARAHQEMSAGPKELDEFLIPLETSLRETSLRETSLSPVGKRVSGLVSR